MTGILDGDATATNVTTGKPETLNLQDPDSMIVDPLGELVMTSQGDGELIVVQHPGLSCQNALVVPLTSDVGGRRSVIPSLTIRYLPTKVPANCW